jgi:hypothetical protein
LGEKSLTIFSGGILTQDSFSHAYQVSSEYWPSAFSTLNCVRTVSPAPQPEPLTACKTYVRKSNKIAAAHAAAISGMHCHGEPRSDPAVEQFCPVMDQFLFL